SRTDSHLPSCKILQLFTQLVLGFHSTVFSPGYLGQLVSRQLQIFLMISPYKSQTKNVAGASGTPCDTTEAVQIQNAGARLSNILDQSLTGICLFDAETLRFHYLNKGAERNLGYDRDSLLMMTLFDIQPELDEASFRTMVSPLVEGRKD